MCGIVTQVGHLSSADSRARSLASMQKRGPDGEGQWQSSSYPVWMGHRRLSIVDLSERGAQPMSNEDGTLHLVCNGEIYNYHSLRKQLEGRGHQFRSDCDSEVILHAYEEFGTATPDHLQGMFAFAIWDEKKRELFAARDAVGIKPLCYTVTDTGLALASDASALLPLLPQRPQPDPTSIAYYLTTGYIPAPRSIWQGIQKVLPGHWMKWDEHKGLTLKQYWEPPRHIENNPNKDSAAWAELFHEVLQDHLLSDVPVGLFLSGGMDSSAVAAGLHQLQAPVEAINISFPTSGLDESAIARETAEHLGMKHRIVPLQVQDVMRLVREVTTDFDEPQGYSALLSMHMVSHAAAQDYKVVLAGDGGDELFGGYRWYQNLNHNSSGTWMRDLTRSMVTAQAPPALVRMAAGRFAAQSPLHRHAWKLYPRFLPEEAQGILGPTDISFTDDDMIAPLRAHFEPTLPLKRALQRVDLMNFCSGSILAKVDRASMAHSLEVRVPFLDRRIIEWALTRPIGPREKHENKPVLRDYLKPRVPASVLNHPKQGFSLRVLDKFDWDAARDCIAQGPFVQNGMFANDWQRYLEPGMPYRDARVWSLFVLSLWGDHWLNKND